MNNLQKIVEHRLNISFSFLWFSYMFTGFPRLFLLILARMFYFFLKSVRGEVPPESSIGVPKGVLKGTLEVQQGCWRHIMISSGGLIFHDLFHDKERSRSATFDESTSIWHALFLRLWIAHLSMKNSQWTSTHHDIFVCAFILLADIVDAARLMRVKSWMNFE